MIYNGYNYDILIVLIVIILVKYAIFIHISCPRCGPDFARAHTSQAFRPLHELVNDHCIGYTVLTLVDLHRSSWDFDEYLCGTSLLGGSSHGS